MDLGVKPGQMELGMLETGDWDKLSDSASSFTLMVIYSKAISKMIKPTEREFIDIRADKRTKVIGLTICNMDKVQKYLKMAQNTQVNSEMDKNTEWESMPGPMVHTIKVSGIIT